MDVESELAKWDSDWSLRTNDVSGWRHVLTIADRCGLDTKPWRTATAAAEFGALPDEPENGSSAVKSDAGVPASAWEPTYVADSLPNELTEYHVTQAFALAHVNALAFDHTQGRWFLFDRSVWRLDERGRAQWIVGEYVAQARAALAAQDKASAAAAFPRNVERSARSHPVIAVSADVWDTDKMLLGVPGGHVNLRTGELHAGDPKKYISLSCSVAPEQGDAPLWSGYLNFVTGGDREFIAWLQRLAGYCLTGDVTEEILAFLYGDQHTGKTTFVKTMESILGSYSHKVPADFFSTTTKLNPEYYRARLAGKRMVVASETQSGMGLADALVKELTGNEGNISGRHPAGRPFEFEMQGKLVLASNKEPQLRGSPEGMRRRLRVVPFRHKPARIDEGFKDALIPEYPRILNWAVEGCLAWQHQRLGWCEPVESASAGYFENQDTFAQWAEERIVRAAGANTDRTTLYADYQTWMQAARESAVSPREFYETIRRHLAVKDSKSNGQKCLRGISLKARPDSAANEFGVVAANDVKRLVN